MAFEWNWQPTPLNLKLKDDRARRAAAAMDGYIPNENNPAVVGSEQAIAQSIVENYRPWDADHGVIPAPTYKMYNTPPGPVAAGQTLGGEGGQQRAMGGDANNYNQGWIYTQKQQELLDEYNRNEARIAEIESKITSIKGQISDNAKRRDQLDMQLAANRAGIGDIGNSIAHQNAIETRKQQEFTRKLELARQNGTASDAEKAVIDAYTELAYAPDEKTQALAQFKVNQALEKYKKATGKPYGANPLQTNLGGAKAGDVATTLERAQGKFSASLDKYGRPTNAAKEEALKDAEGLPYTKELQEWIDKVRNTETQEERAAKDAKASKANQAAVDEAAKEISGFDMKEGESKDWTASNKKTVTIKKSGGKLTFTCGKAVKTK